MKKFIVTALVALVSQTAFAGELHCGVNIETTRGSQVYNKSVFWEKVDTSKHTTHFLLKDGTLLRQQDLTPDTLAQITNGSLGMSISFSPEGKAQVFLAKVKRNKNNEVTFINNAVATSASADDLFLMANNAVIMCKEM